MWISTEPQRLAGSPETLIVEAGDERLDVGGCVRSELADATGLESLLVMRPSKVRGNRWSPWHARALT